MVNTQNFSILSIFKHLYLHQTTTRFSMAIRLLTVTLLLVLISPASAQEHPARNNIRLLNNFFIDTSKSTSPFIAGKVGYADYTIGSDSSFALKGSLPINDQIDIGLQWVYSTNDISPNSDSSGLGPLELNSRYYFDLANSPVKMAVGGLITLPIGADDVAGDQFNLGAFIASRYPVQNNMVLSANLGLYSIDTPIDRELSVHLGFGTLFKLDETIHLIGEITIKTEQKYAALTTGADIQLANKIHTRPALSVGLNDGAADLELQIELVIHL